MMSGDRRQGSGTKELSTMETRKTPKSRSREAYARRDCGLREGMSRLRGALRGTCRGEASLGNFILIMTAVRRCEVAKILQIDDLRSGGGAVGEDIDFGGVWRKRSMARTAVGVEDVVN